MAKTYCHQCAVQQGKLDNVFTSTPLESQYQYDKFKKHTALSTQYTLQSVFTSTSTDAYAGFIVRAGSSGALEIDDRGRRNLIVLATETTGTEYMKGRVRATANAVKIVLSSASDEVHAYPVSLPDLPTEVCCICGDRVST